MAFMITPVLSLVTCLGIDGYTIHSWPRNSKKKLVGDGRGLPGNVFSLLERTPRQEMALVLLLNIVSGCDTLDKSLNLYNPYLW